VTAVLLVASAILLVIGVAAERSQGHVHDESPAVVHDETAEGSEAHERAEAVHDEAGETSAQQGAATDERLLGVDTESTPAIAAAALISVLLATGITWRPARALIAAAVVFAVVAGAVDVTEIARQLDEGRTRLAVIAVLVLVVHAGAALSGAYALDASTRTGQPLEPASDE
jgi:hypothetical protein